MPLKNNSVYTLNNGLTIPISGYGLYLVPVQDSKKLTYQALKAGYRHIDSARGYYNERESAEGIAQFLRDFPEVKRSEIFFTTKLNSTEGPYDNAKQVIQNTIAILSKSIDYVDLYLIHSPMSNRAKRLGTYQALQEAVDSGKLKSIGVSNYGVRHLDELFAWDGLRHKPVVNQVELQPWLPRKDLQAYAKRTGLILQAFSPLTQAKKFRDPELLSIAKKHGYTPAQVLLAWSHAQGFVPIAKTVNEHRMRENYSVVEEVKLDQEDLKILEKGDSYEVLTWDPTVYVDPR